MHLREPVTTLKNTGCGKPEETTYSNFVGDKNVLLKPNCVNTNTFIQHLHHH